MEMPDEAGGLRGDIIATYRRSGIFIRRLPIIVAIPFAAEMIQHVAEIGMGLYVGDHLPSAADRGTRAGFAAVKSLAMLVTMLLALRWWRFEGDHARILRIDLALVRGVVITLLVEIGGSSLLQMAGYMIGSASRAAIGSIAWLIATVVPVILWAMLSVLLFPWYVALLSDDPEMGIERSLKSSYPIWGRCFALYMAATLPPMIVHYLLGFSAVGRPAWMIWPLLLLASAAGASMAVQFASAYYTIYLRARAK